MKILYLASSADFHVDLWVKYFKENNKVFLFSDSQNYLQDQKFQNVELIKSVGLFGQFWRFGLFWTFWAIRNRTVLMVVILDDLNDLMIRILIKNKL